MIDDEVRELKTVMVERLDRIDGRLDKIDGRLDTMDGHLLAVDGRLDTDDSRFDRFEQVIRDESAETREYVDLRVGRLHVDVEEQFKRQRQLIGTEFAKATAHADTLHAKLLEQLAAHGEHQTLLFERQERLDDRVTRLEREGKS